jgi:hypothetical protein
LTIEIYFSQIKAIVDHYTGASFVTNVSVNLETRPGKQGFLAGAIEFVDGSEFYFREYLDAASDDIEKIMYSYHYQDATTQMILRYDNSAHRPVVGSLEHIHDDAGVRPHSAPRLEDVLAEIIELKNWAE